MAKILVIEDYAWIRDLYRELLTQEKHEVETAEDGESGLEKAKKTKFDLILLDLVLPKKDGLTVLAELQALNKEQPLTKIVSLSTIGEKELVDKAMKLGASGNIVKSTSFPEKIVEDIKEFLSQKR